MLGAGGYDQTSLELSGTFCAKTLGIEPQPIQLRIFVEIISPTASVFIRLLTPSTSSARNSMPFG